MKVVILDVSLKPSLNDGLTIPRLVRIAGRDRANIVIASRVSLRLCTRVD